MMIKWRRASVRRRSPREFPSGSPRPDVQSYLQPCTHPRNGENHLVARFHPFPFQLVLPLFAGVWAVRNGPRSSSTRGIRSLHCYGGSLSLLWLQYAAFSLSPWSMTCQGLSSGGFGIFDGLLQALSSTIFIFPDISFDRSFLVNTLSCLVIIFVKRCDLIVKRGLGDYYNFFSLQRLLFPLPSHRESLTAYSPSRR